MRDVGHTSQPTIDHARRNSGTFSTITIKVTQFNQKTTTTLHDLHIYNQFSRKCHSGLATFFAQRL